MKLVSIIIPMYNSESFIFNTLELLMIVPEIIVIKYVRNLHLRTPDFICIKMRKIKASVTHAITA